MAATTTMMVTVLIVEVMMIIMMMMQVEGNDKLCLPGLVPFLQAYISHYIYKEVHIIFNGTGEEGKGKRRDVRWQNVLWRLKIFMI